MKNRLTYLYISFFLLSTAVCRSQTPDSLKLQAEPYYNALKYFVKWQKIDGTTPNQKRSKNYLNFNISYDPILFALTADAISERNIKIDSFNINFLKDPVHVYDQIKPLLLFYNNGGMYQAGDSLFDIYTINNPVALKENCLLYTFDCKTYVVKNNVAILFQTDQTNVYLTLTYDCDKHKYYLKKLWVGQN